MTTVHGVVRALHGDQALVEVAQVGCGRCHEEGGCGGQQLTQMMCTSPKTYPVDNTTGAAVGDRVTVAIAAGAVRRSANLAYGMPVAALVVGAALGTWAAGDPGAIAGAAIGLGAAWSLLRIRTAGAGNRDIRPYIISRS